MNVEIQQRACEFIIILSDGWANERNGIFEPMPFKGDENMTFDATDRAALDADEGDGQLLIGFGDAPSAPAKATTQAQPEAGGLLDMGDLLGGPSNPAPVQTTDNNNMMGDMMDLFGGGPTAPATQTPIQAPSGGGGGDLMDMLGGIDLGGGQS